MAAMATVTAVTAIGTAVMAIGMAGAVGAGAAGAGVGARLGARLWLGALPLALLANFIAQRDATKRAAPRLCCQLSWSGRLKPFFLLGHDEVAPLDQHSEERETRNGGSRA